ncbi:phosphatidylethanolamine-binding protein 4 isoform X2 [Hemicordylus capensis]|uniref:phosphatidylethanolamine-binding protein 4 isoform X2 n=1 Tax=Hemicordylus capensis TaxID=884348 RepID=UPI002304BB82|nr:phosphatidylethanolamine-binding protein 4 isoform X2 [Hemicordylus capensis]
MVRMKPLVTYFLAVGLTAVAVQEGVSAQMCTFDLLDKKDSQFCRGKLEIIYPELGDVGCTYIPACNQYRKLISNEWKSPTVRYRKANENKEYVLIMVDPDAPSRATPKYRFWRHWLVSNIKVSQESLMRNFAESFLKVQVDYVNWITFIHTAADTLKELQKGADLKNGNLQGNVLSDYLRPTPPPKSGFHRYQFLIFEQPAHQTIALSLEESASPGSWEMESFVEKFELGVPVASTQFLTRNFKE